MVPASVGIQSSARAGSYFRGTLLGLAARHRFRLVPALERALSSGEPPHALAALRRSLAIDTLLGFAILGLPAWLGMLDPSNAAGSAQ